MPVVSPTNNAAPTGPPATPTSEIAAKVVLAQDEYLRWYLHDLHECVGALIQTVRQLQKSQQEARVRGNGHIPQ